MTSPAHDRVNKSLVKITLHPSPDEIETEYENTLACLSGGQMGSNHDKKLDVENLMTHSL